MYACALAGTPLVPLNPAFIDEEASSLLHRAEIALVFTVPEYRGSALLQRAFALVSQGGRAVSLLEMFDELPDLGDALPEVDAQSPFVIQYTSGTTGRPKGAVFSHFAAYNSARIGIDAILPSGDAVFFCALSLHHVGEHGERCIRSILNTLPRRGHCWRPDQDCSYPQSRVFRRRRRRSSIGVRGRHAGGAEACKRSTGSARTEVAPPAHRLLRAGEPRRRCAIGTGAHRAGPGSREEGFDPTHALSIAKEAESSAVAASCGPTPGHS